MAEGALDRLIRQTQRAGFNGLDLTTLSDIADKVQGIPALAKERDDIRKSAVEASNEALKNQTAMEQNMQREIQQRREELTKDQQKEVRLRELEKEREQVQDKQAALETQLEAVK